MAQAKVQTHRAPAGVGLDVAGVDLLLERTGAVEFIDAVGREVGQEVAGIGNEQIARGVGIGERDTDGANVAPDASVIRVVGDGGQNGGGCGNGAGCADVGPLQRAVFLKIVDRELGLAAGTKLDGQAAECNRLCSVEISDPKLVGSGLRSG